jgi:hypothetical protein
MSCRSCRMQPMKGSGYVKESSGNSEALNAQLNAYIAQRDASDNSQMAIDVPIHKSMEIAIHSYALDRYVTEKAQRGIRFKDEKTPDFTHMREVVDTHLDALHLSLIRYNNPIRKTSDYLDYAQCVNSRWGACAVHVFLRF